MKSVNELRKTPRIVLEDGQWTMIGFDREFSCVFEPDTKHEDFQVGMSFRITSVNRQTGEIIFRCD